MSVSPTTTHDATDPYDQLRNHAKVDRVVSYDDHVEDDGAMVILDWVTDSTTENGTRIIHEKNYDGHIREVNEFIEQLPGVTKTRAGKSGLATYTIHIERTER